MSPDFIRITNQTGMDSIIPTRSITLVQKGEAPDGHVALVLADSHLCVYVTGDLDYFENLLEARS